MEKSNENIPLYLYSERELKKLDTFIENEYETYLEVFHEILSPDIHLDAVIVPPTEEQPYYKFRLPIVSNSWLAFGHTVTAKLFCKYCCNLHGMQ